MYKHILVPTDGSALSKAAVAKASELANGIGARITVLTVTEPFRLFSMDPDQLENTPRDYDRLAEKMADYVLSEAHAALTSAGTRCDTTRRKSHDTAETIVEFAQQNDCDLIAMASHGREGFTAFMIGSVTMKVLAHTKLPVLVFR